jgi:dihydropteroate synthase
MTELVGILNVTPDSFSDGGLYVEPALALQQAAQLLADGASLIDIGAESTRPNAQKLTAAEEWLRLRLILPELMRRYPKRLTLDTYHPETAERALKLGAIKINDVTGMNNPRMIEVVTRYDSDCIVSHLSGTDTQAAHQGVLIADIQVVIDDLLAKASLLRAEGLGIEQIILDPGIGFGKTPELNVSLLEFAKYAPDYKVMIGYSRKRFLGDNRMDSEVNLKAGRTATAAGAAYLRVHDVAGHRSLLASV